MRPRQNAAPTPPAHKQIGDGEEALTRQDQTPEGPKCVNHDTRPENMLLQSSEWLMCYHKHPSNLQLGCEELQRHEDKQRYENKGEEKPREL